MQPSQVQNLFAPPSLLTQMDDLDGSHKSNLKNEHEDQ